MPCHVGLHSVSVDKFLARAAAICCDFRRRFRRADRTDGNQQRSIARRQNREARVATHHLTVERLSDGDVALLLEHLSHVEVAARCLYVVYSELLGRVVDLCQHDTTQRNSRPRHRPD